MPAALQRSSSPASASAVTATIGVRTRLSADSMPRISPVMVKPSISGMWTSAKTMS